MPSSACKKKTPTSKHPPHTSHHKHNPPIHHSSHTGKPHLRRPRSSGLSPAAVDPGRGLRFFFNDTAPTELYTLSLHDALPINDTATTEIYPLSLHDALRSRWSPYH